MACNGFGRGYDNDSYASQPASRSRRASVAGGHTLSKALAAGGYGRGSSSSCVAKRAADGTLRDTVTNVTAAAADGSCYGGAAAVRSSRPRRVPRRFYDHLDCDESGDEGAELEAAAGGKKGGGMAEGAEAVPITIGGLHMMMMMVPNADGTGEQLVVLPGSDSDRH